MSVGANVAVMVAAKQRRYIRRFQKAGATCAERAKSLEELGCRRSAVFQSLVNQGVFVEAPSGKFHLDLEALESRDSLRQRLMMILIAVIIVTFTVVLLTR